MKAAPTALVRAHLHTLSDARDGKLMRSDLTIFFGVPALVGFACFWPLGVNMSPTAAAGLLTVTGLFGAFLFAVMLQVSERAMTWADSQPRLGKATNDHTIFLGELAANAGYASLAATATSAVFVVASITTGAPNTVAASVGLALGLHSVLTLFMVVKRVYTLTMDRLTRARTGAGYIMEDNVTHMDDRRSV